jgi:hypothetical protein
MTNVFGSGAPAISSVDEADTGPLQLGHRFTTSTSCVITHVRYYVATATMAGNTSGALPFYAWRVGEPDSTVTGTLTIPGSVGWVTEELSPHLFIPADRRFGIAVSLPSGTISYGVGFGVLPRSSRLLQCEGSNFLYDNDPINAYSGLNGVLGTSYLIDVEVAVSEMVNLAPDDLTDGDVVQIRRTINGTVNSITPITDAYTVNVHVDGGPLDGEDVDVWVPDTVNGLAAADMQLLKEVDAPDLLSRWEASDGSLWAYVGGGVYDCLISGTSYPADSKTTRASTPSLSPWSP